MNAAADRRFTRIFFLSLALHVAILVGWRLSLPAVAKPPVLVASLRLTASGETSSAPAAEPLAQPKVRQGNPARSSRLPAPAIHPAGPTRELAAAPQPSVPQPVPDVAVPAERGGEAPAVKEMPGEAGGVQQSNEALAAYRRDLTSWLAGFHEYPRVAALRGWEGEVRLRLRIARRGNLLAVILDRSSGFDVLDRHALELLNAHGDLPPVPDAVAGSEIQIVVPIQYRLKKTT